MKTQLARALLVLAAASVLALAPLQAHANRCSQASAAGSWAYTAGVLGHKASRMRSSCSRSDSSASLMQMSDTEPHRNRIWTVRHTTS
jgi:Tfp pilus assembly protein PilV